MSDNRRIAIMGGSESGKTFLTKSYTRGLWREEKRRSLVFDPFARESTWGPHAWVTDKMPQFEHVVFKLKGCCAVWDEGTSTGGRDRDKTHFFTAMRHNHPRFVFIGHDWATMLPVMRTSLTDIVLFRQPKKSAEFWCEQFTDEEILQAVNLEQYEILHKRAFRPVRRVKFTAEELKRGVVL